MLSTQTSTTMDLATQYVEFLTVTLTDLQYQHGNYGVAGANGNTIVEIYINPFTEPDETQLARNPSTGKTTTRLQYPRMTIPEAPPTEGKDTKKKKSEDDIIDIIDPFDMPLTPEGATSFQRDTQKYAAADKRHRDEYNAAAIIDSNYLAKIMSKISPSSINQGKLSTDFDRIFAPAVYGNHPCRAHDFLLLLKNTFDKPNPAGIASTVGKVLSHKYTPGISIFDHLSTTEVLSKAAISSLDPTSSGFVPTELLRSLFLLQTFSSATNTPSMTRALINILKDDTHLLCPVPIATEIFIHEEALNNAFTSDHIPLMPITALLAPIIPDKSRRDRAYRDNKIADPNATTPPCERCLKLVKRYNYHKKEECRMLDHKNGTPAPGQPRGLIATTGAVPIDTAAQTAAAVAAATAAANAAHESEITRLNTLVREQREETKQQTEMMRGLIGSLSYQGPP
jgi:hypothetical protein